MVQINDVIGIIKSATSNRANHRMAWEYEGLDANGRALKWTQDGQPQVWDVVASVDNDGVEDAIVVCYDQSYGSIALLTGGWEPATSTEDGDGVDSPAAWLGNVQFGKDTVMAGDFVAVNKNTWGGNGWLFKDVDGALTAQKVEVAPPAEPEPVKVDAPTTEPKATPAPTPATETKPEPKAKATVKDKPAPSDKAE